ncbi:uncharacterized protein LOC112046793 [Bicyclus anynana]|uniref:Uncharacterized protein LOC112046793 n=1 Tax=Bicyclus anynana TaxID=110368 RepID=A0ABM3M7H1_BICAN|nr:uncharacterized protein LOC112046793 [Bicyclus anynana]
MSDKYRKCVKCGASAFKDPTLTFHSFPRAGKASSCSRLRIWAEYCFANVTEKELKGLHGSHKLLCSKHFHRSAYTDDTMKKLNRDAVPNVSSSPVETSQQHFVSEELSVPLQPTIPNVPILSQPPDTPHKYLSQVNPSVPSQLSVLDEPILVLPDPSQQTIILKSPSVSKSIHPENQLGKQQLKKCKKYLNKIYRLKMALKKKKNVKGNRKCFLEALTKTEYFEKFNQYLNPAFGVLLQSQMTNSRRKLQGRRWTLNEKILALAIYKKSSACYKLLRRMMCLPNPGTLKCLLNRVYLPCGVNKKVMASLKEISQGEEKKDNLWVLLFDEMSIRKNLIYNPKTDAIEGYQDHGSQGRNQQMASHALVFMLVGLRKRWKQPIAHFFSGDSVTADRLQAIIKEVLAECFSHNLVVVATVCDMDGVNMRALNALGSTVDRPFFIYNENEIVTIMDPPHLLKCFRNNFLKHNIKCPDNFATNAVSGIAKWEHIKEFFKNDNNNPNFVFAPALTDQHIHPNGKQKMKVKLAAQVLSHSVAAGIFAKVARNEISPEAVVTATLISKMDNIFDSLNADTPDLKRGKRYFTNITKKSEHLQLFHDMKTLFQNICFIGVRCAPPSVNGWIRTIRAVERLWHNLQKLNINALATRRLNQDPLENLFGCIRGHCGSNPNPNVPQFIAGLKTSIG